MSADSGDAGGGTLGTPSLMALAAGGMVGGGIYVALGVVVEAAGEWAWLSFVIAGIVAVATASSYAALSNQFEVGGGAFEFLEELDHERVAGALGWVLVIAYTLTIALYAYAFGEYVAYGLGLGAPVPRLCSIVILAALTGLDLLGAGKLKVVEIVIVSANLLILVGLAVVGVGDWSPDELTLAAGSKGPWSALVGAAAIFVSYEGFQLLTYEYDELREPKRILRPGLVVSAVVVVAVYVAVAVGATMILGADRVVDEASVALSVAAEDALGTAGLVAMTVAAAFATSAAINSTLFSAAKLGGRIAERGELPTWFEQRNAHDIPGRAVLVISGLAAVLAVIGSLSSLVEAASIAFLVAFGAVNAIAFRRRAGSRWISGIALAVGAPVAAVLVARLVATKPIALGLMVVLFAVAFVGRPKLLEHVRTEPAK